MNDIDFIYTNPLEEAIRCAMCTNPMRSDKGCDGGCKVDERMYERVINAVKDLITTATKNLTNGDVIKSMFPDSHIVFSKEYGYHYVYVSADCEGSSWKIREEWWNAPYKRGEEDEVSDRDTR